jgi:precorrin-6B methylase 2
MNATLNPGHILQTGMAFWASKTLLSAVELEVFTQLGAATLTGAELGERIGLHPRSRYDFLDALVALGFLTRAGDGPTARYGNTAETAAFLDKNRPAYVGGILEMANERLYKFWGDLTTGLKTGLPQNEIKLGQGSPFEIIYADEQRLELFLRAMQGVQMGNFMTLVQKVDLSRYATHVDVGGANGTLAIILARAFPNLHCKSFDLAPVSPVARRNVAAAGQAERVEVVTGDFFTDPLPRADVITMGNILHDWDEAQKKALIAKAFAALEPGGLFIAIENVIDDARRENAFGLLMSLNMLIELPGGFDYTGAQFNAWCTAAGFARTQIVPLTGGTSAAIAYK